MVVLSVGTKTCTAPGLGQEAWRIGRCGAGKAEDLQKGWAVGQGAGNQPCKEICFGDDRGEEGSALCMSAPGSSSLYPIEH